MLLSLMSVTGVNFSWVDLVYLASILRVFFSDGFASNDHLNHE